jgi:hypothetical protein
VNLNRAERDYYVLAITTDPALTGTWEAAFVSNPANGDYVDGTNTGDGWAWLVAGPDFDAAEVGMDDADTDATVTAKIRPHVRLKDNPVVKIDSAPLIRLVT